MDKSKQPGIIFNDIILKDLVFSRKEGFSENPEFIIQLESNASLSPNEDTLTYEMSCEIKDKNEYLYIKCTMIGFFSPIKGQENMTLKEYSNINAPAAIFPYIREVIASTTTRAGIPSILIPPTNLNLVKKNSNIEKESLQ